MAINQVVVSHTRLPDEIDAGNFLADEVLSKLGGQSPDVLIVFASPEYAFVALLQALERRGNPGIMVGCSSAGEFSGAGHGTSSVSVLAIRADDIVFNAALGRGLRADPARALDQIMPVFRSEQHPDFPHRYALVMIDALAGYTDAMVGEMAARTSNLYQMFGGGAADDTRFERTHVFIGSAVHEDAIVVLEMLSKRPFGIGVTHGWEPVGETMFATQARGTFLVSLDHTPAVEVFSAHAARTGQRFERDDPLPFFLHNLVGIETPQGYTLRVPLSVRSDGAVALAAAIPAGAAVKLMVSTTASVCDAASAAAACAVRGLQGGRHAGSLLFDCAATRVRLGPEFGDELDAVASSLGSPNFAGCNTYGQMALAKGQFNGFHNCTAIVCAIPE